MTRPARGAVVARLSLRRRRELDVSDATTEPDPGPPPEAVFDRATGPWAGRLQRPASPRARGGDDTP